MIKDKILVVDDEKDSCEAFKNFFSKRGYLVHVAGDGLKAQELLQNNHYRFIFLDCHMPGLSGVELAKVIKKLDPQSIKVMISGYQSLDPDLLKELGIDQFFKKPISLSQIENFLKEHRKENPA
ncbi:MAG: response regulator [Candidatus Omnitrophica bacterium]|nr:response regulator [Candidatus Omnitrophota bacterium]